MNLQENLFNVYIWNDLLKEGRQCQQTTLSASRWQPLFPLLDIVFTTTIDVPRDKGEASRVQGQDVWVREARNRGSLLPMWVGQPCAMPMDRQTRWGDGISLASDCCFCYLLTLHWHSHYHSLIFEKTDIDEKNRSLFMFSRHTQHSRREEITGPDLLNCTGNIFRLLIGWIIWTWLSIFDPKILLISRFISINCVHRVII